ncbi:cytochrome P450 [Actinocrispum wychmicini]|uniref:Cytochrome P450 n=1 Tax=Actinocrispum wychmicini TaxID=1213861 RepID=A0A4R2JV10_9PSEU|nr:cytochrome P450 [Actinocrispum wychmicini]TCO61178.1 cytochrome P450 [Actinocrispum wychmicini]
MTEQGRTAARKSYWDYPYPHYREIQRDTPVHYDEHLSAWLVTSYSAVVDALHHPHLSSAWLDHRADLHGKDAANARYVRSVFSRWFVLVDAPEHPQLRKSVIHAFTRRAIADLTPFVERRAAELLAAAIAAGGPVDVMADLATPLSASVIAHLLGMGQDVAAELPRWGAVFAKYLANAARTDAANETAAAVREISAVVRDQLPDAPAGSLVYELTNPVSGEPASVDDLVSTISLLLYAGLESTSNLIGLGVLALAERPGLRAELAGASAETMAAAIEELLRYDTSVLQVPRVATADMTLGGQRIHRGDLVVVMLGAANHDERRFPDPDTFDLRRDVSRHVAFGYGVHFCVGAPLARAEAAAFFTVLLRTAPEFALTAQPRWSSRHSVRSLDALPVLLFPAHQGVVAQ